MAAIHAPLLWERCVWVHCHPSWVIFAVCPLCRGVHARRFLAGPSPFRTKRYHAEMVHEKVRRVNLTRISGTSEEEINAPPTADPASTPCFRRRYNNDHDIYETSTALPRTPPPAATSKTPRKPPTDTTWSALLHS